MDTGPRMFQRPVVDKDLEGHQEVQNETPIGTPEPIVTETDKPFEGE